MSITKAFFVREIVRLRHNIATLGLSLEDYAPDDPNAAGQRQILQNEQKCRELLLDLAEYAADPGTLLARLRIEYMLAQKSHDRYSQSHPLNGASPDDGWWDSLGRMQYLRYLIVTFNRMLKEASRADIEEELRRAVAYKDLGASLQRNEILRAIARAEDSAASRASLTRDDAEPGDLNGGGR